MSRHRIAPSSAPPSLPKTIGALCQDILTMRNELDEARAEIARLKKELATRKVAAPSPGPQVRALRRQIAFYCHPDRGGDHRVMQQVNALFDHLEHELPRMKKSS